MKPSTWPRQYLHLVLIASFIGVLCEYMVKGLFGFSLNEPVNVFIFYTFLPPIAIGVYLQLTLHSLLHFSLHTLHPFIDYVTPFVVYPAYYALYFLPAKSIFALRQDPALKQEKIKFYKAMVLLQWLLVTIQLIIGIYCVIGFFHAEAMHRAQH